MAEESVESAKLEEDKEIESVQVKKKKKIQIEEKEMEEKESYDDIDDAAEIDSDFDLGSLNNFKESNIVQQEEYDGEDAYFAPEPRHFEIETESEKVDQTEEVEKAVSLESLETEERSEASEIGIKEEIIESSMISPTKSEELGQLRMESVFENLFLLPKEKTSSEIKFEREHREYIEEEMKKVLQRAVLKEEDVTEMRKPLEKRKLTLTEVDTSRLYPQPKTIESEVSFAFDEDEEGKREFKPQKTVADVTKQVMDSLRERDGGDPNGIFVKEIMLITNELERFIEDVVSSIRRGITIDIPKVANEILPELKPESRNVVISTLREKVSIYEKITEVKEKEEEVKKIEKREVTTSKKEATASQKVVTPARVEMTHEKSRKIPMEKVMEKPFQLESVKPEKTIQDKTDLALAEEIKKLVSKAEEKLLPQREVYESVDWELFLSESETKMEEDPDLRKEMEKYIAERKAELLSEQRAARVKIAREKRYKSRDSEIMLENANLHVTMKFILNSGETFTFAYKYFMTFSEIKEDLAGIFRVPPDILIIYRDKTEVRDEQRAYDLEPKIEPFDCVTFRLLTLDNDKWRLKSSHLELAVPDIITCTVETGRDDKGISEFKEVVVEIEQKKIKKPFVGGYRDTCTGIEYHHAFSQSAPREPSIPYNRKVSQDTQTVKFESKSIDTNCNKYTQMSRSDFHISTEFDKIMTPLPYVDYETWIKQKDMEGKVLTIQKYVRAMIIRKFIKKMSDEYRERKIWEEEQERKRFLEREIRIRQGIINMVYPKTKADFEALYAMVEKWRKAQIERISKLKTEAPKKAELCLVLEKEIKLLEAIEMHRIAVAKTQRKKKELTFLAKVSKPITWTGYRGITIHMDTLKTQKARELQEMYLALSRDDMNPQDRIELLISLKYALRVNCTRLTDELVNLLNRECELLIRGVSWKKLEYLRRRISHLFLKYFKDPEFNPEVAKYDPEYNQENLKQNVLFCKMCHQMKMYHDFGINARDTSCNICQSCRTVYNIAVPRVDLNPFRYILKCVRKDEQKRSCFSSCAFILQDEDMRFLVENIWRCRSAISENDKLMDLRMPRWDKDKDWTPWNCILLTEAESKAHLRSHPSLNYEPQLIGEIVSKHQLAKRHFQQMFATEKRMRDSGKWVNFVDTKDYVPPPVAADIWDLTKSERERIKEKETFNEIRKTMQKE